jgi:hypothetical protein
MAHMGIVESDNERAEFRQREPHWDLPLEHSSLGRSIAVRGRRPPRTFAGDHQHCPGTLSLRPNQEAQQRRVRPRLRHAMKIDASINGIAAPRHPLLLPSLEPNRCGDLASRPLLYDRRYHRGGRHRCGHGWT